MKGETTDLLAGILVSSCSKWLSSGSDGREGRSDVVKELRKGGCWSLVGRPKILGSGRGWWSQGVQEQV